MNPIKRIAQGFIAFCTSTAALASITVYTDRSVFEAALTSRYTETFTANMLNGTGASFVSYNGFIAANQFNDTVADGTPNTTWSFASSTNGFGANWDLSPGGPGYGIEFLIDGVIRVPRDIPRRYMGEFFGFISDVPFTSVKVQDSTYQINSFGLEQYYMDNMTYGITASVPDPKAYATLLVGLGILAVLAGRRRRCARN